MRQREEVHFPVANAPLKFPDFCEVRPGILYVRRLRADHLVTRTLAAVKEGRDGDLSS